MDSFFTRALGGLFLVANLFSISADGIELTPSWKPRELITSFADSNRHFDMDHYLAFDHFGNAAVAFAYDSLPGGAGTPGLGYAQRTPGVGWSSSIIDTSLIGYPSLAFNRYENPVIAYLDFTSPTARVELKTYDSVNRTFITQSVASSIQPGTGPSLALDALDRPVVLAKRDTFNPSFYTDFDGDGTWSATGTTNAGIAAAGSPSLAVDDQGRWHAAFYGSVFDRVEYVVNSGATTRSSSPSGLAGSQTGLTRSVAINPITGYPAMAVSRAGTGDLLYTEWDGQNFQTLIVDGVDNTGESPSLAFDPSDGRPAIAYYDVTNDDLRFAWRDGLGNWQKQTVDTNGGKNPSLAFREFGGTQVAGIAFFQGDTLYFRLDPPLLVPEPSCVVLLMTGAVLWIGRRRAGRRRGCYGWQGAPR